jgi:hypothetical protein
MKNMNDAINNNVNFYQSEETSFNNNESELLLVKRKSVDGRFIAIYADNAGRIKASFTEKDGKIIPAFFIKGINNEIDISNKELIQSVQYVLKEHCYFRIVAGDVEVNLRIKGGDWIKGLMASGGQIAIGLSLTFFTGGIALPLLGATLVGAGCRTSLYCYKNREKFDNRVYVREVIIGGAGGFAGGAAGQIASSAFNLLANPIINGGISGTVSTITKSTTESQLCNKESDLSLYKVAEGAVEGAALGALKSAGNVAYSVITTSKAATEEITKDVGPDIIKVAARTTPSLNFFKAIKAVKNMITSHSTGTHSGASFMSDFGILSAARSQKRAREETTPINKSSKRLCK